MSFSEKIASIMERPGQDPASKDDVPWWMKYASRGLGTVGGVIAIFLGAWSCVGIILGGIGCFLGGMWQMVAGFVIITIEAPCCCMFIDFVQNLSDWVERRPYWNRAAGYCLISLPPIFLCPDFGNIFACGLLFSTGAIYGLMSLGKKAPISEMKTAAVGNTQNPSSNLVDNAQPMGLSEKPDSNV